MKDTQIPIFAIMIFILSTTMFVFGIFQEKHIKDSDFIKAKAHIDTTYQDSEGVVILALTYKTENDIVSSDIGKFMEYNPGDSVDIIYNKNKPREIYPPNRKQRDFWGYSLLFSIPSFAYIIHWFYTNKYK